MRVRGWGRVLWWGAALFYTVPGIAASYTVPGMTPCAGYTVVKRSYPPSTVPTAIVIKCPAGAGWRDQIVVKGVLAACQKGVAFSLQPRDVVITCR